MVIWFSREMYVEKTGNDRPVGSMINLPEFPRSATEHKHYSSPRAAALRFHDLDHGRAGALT
jgi:hypothetical protein